MNHSYNLILIANRAVNKKASWSESLTLTASHKSQASSHVIVLRLVVLLALSLLCQS